jgi:hypothetical protein
MGHSPSRTLRWISQILWIALGQNQYASANFANTAVSYEGLMMSRYFFDVVGAQRCEYDYRGRELPTLEKAYRLAELIALDYAIHAGDELTGFTINVRGADGREFFSVPVQSSYVAAA